MNLKNLIMNTYPHRSSGSKVISQFIYFVALFILPMNVYAVQIEVSISPPQVKLNEAFKLSFTTHGESDGAPDFRPLNADFEMLGQRQSSQSSWVNGEQTHTISWVIDLMARHQGPALIPAIQFGDDVSESLQFVVEQGQSPDEMLLKVMASPQTPYIQSQIIYTWQFYRRADINMSNARLSEPQVENAVRVALGENRQFQRNVEGVEYVVTEGRYAIFPQKSGLLRIPPLVLTAELLDPGQSNRGGFFGFRNSVTRRVVSSEIEVQVEPVPKAFGAAQWLAAEQLELTESWSDESLQLQPGESLTRTISLRASGVLKSQLPELNTKLTEPGLSAYADQPLLAEQAFENGVSAMREQKTAFIAAQPGQYTLPAIEVPWFNTHSGEVEIARLPPRNLTVLAGVEQSPVASIKQPVVDAQHVPAALQAETGRMSDEVLFWKVLSALLLIGWAMSMVFFIWKQKRRKVQTKTAKIEVQQDMRKLRTALKIACKGSHARAARQALLDWGKLSYQADSLSALYPFCSAELRQQIGLLEQTLYSDAGAQWSGEALWREFEKGISPPSSSDTPTSALAPLYPS